MLIMQFFKSSKLQSIKLRYEGGDSVLGQAWNAEQTGSHFTPLQLHFFHFDKGKNVHKHSSTWFSAGMLYDGHENTTNDQCVNKF